MEVNYESVCFDHSAESTLNFDAQTGSEQFIQKAATVPVSLLEIYSA